MQKKAVLLWVGYAIPESSTEQMSFPKKTLKSAGVHWNFEKLFLREFVTSVHSTFLGKESLKVAPKRTHWDAVSYSEISGRDTKKCKERTVRCTSTKAFPVENMGEPQNLKYCRYRSLLDK